MPTQSSRGSQAGGAKAASGKKPPTAFQIWFEDAWAGWLKHVSLILFAALLSALYQLDLFTERMLGLIMALGVSLGAMVMAASPARAHAQTRTLTAVLYLLCAVWALDAIYPIVYGIFPGKAYASGKLTDEGSEVTLSAPSGGKAVYTTAKLRGGGDVNAPFVISGRWDGGAGQVKGELTRNIVRVRVGRRGSGSATTEFNEQTHYLGRTRGAVTLKLEQKDENIDKEVTIELRPAPLPPLIIYVTAGLVFVFALALDRMLDRKGRTSLGISAAVSLLFA